MARLTRLATNNIPGYSYRLKDKGRAGPIPGVEPGSG